MDAGLAFARVAAHQVRYVHPVRPPGIGLVADVYRQARRDMRLLVPPVSLHSPAPEVLAGSWMLLRETLLADGAADRLAKEAVAAGVSVANTCPYCATVHETAMYGLTAEADAVAIAADRPGDVTDPALRAVATWARTCHRPGRPGLATEHVDPAAVPELVGVAVALHYLTRMVDIFLSDLLPASLTGPPRRVAKRAIGRMQRPVVARVLPAGRSLTLLPHAPLPADALWAAPVPAVATAVARAAAVFEAAGRKVLSDAARALVHRRLADWDGEPPGPSRAWSDDAVRVLTADQRPGARLALLTALAHHQVDGQVVAAFRTVQPSEAALVGATAWASFAAARTIGARLAHATT
jgi:AhpD family alkylhydroperoxidase